MARCKIMGNDVQWPCPLSMCSLFGDCLAEYRKVAERKHTNADRIRSMSDEELAEFLYAVETRRCYTGSGAQWLGGPRVALDWLQQPAEEG